MIKLLKKVVSFSLSIVSRLKDEVHDLVEKETGSIVTFGFAAICFVVFWLPLPEEYVAFNLARLLQYPLDLLFWLSLPLSWVSHAGFGHILGNMLFFLLLAPYVEKKLGTKAMIWTIVMSGLAGTTVLSFDGNADAYSLGASGVVYGIIGAFLVLQKKRLLSYFLIPVVSLDVLVELIRSGSSSGIGHMAHFGGFLGGVIVVLWLLAFKSSKKK